MSSTTRRGPSRQRGIVSILVVVFLFVVVVFLLSQPIFMAATRSVDDTQQLKSLNSMYMAENGIEQAATQLVIQAEFGLPEFRDTCVGLTAQPSFEFSGGTFRFVTAPTNPKPTCCNIRAQGEVSGVTRIIQKTLCVQSELGYANFGGKMPKPVVMKIKNRSAKDGVAVFNFAWRRQGSEPNATIGNSVSATCNNCSDKQKSLWQLESSTGTPSVGSLGAGKLVPRRERVDIEVSIQEDRNFVYVGMILPGDDVQLVGSFFKQQNPRGTKDNSASAVSEGEVDDGITLPAAAPWCRNADTMIYGVSGKADPAQNADLSAKFTEVRIDTGTGLRQKNWTLIANNNPNYVAHFPIAGTETAWGDIFSEIYVLFNPNIGVPTDSGILKVTQALVGGRVVLEDKADVAGKVPLRELVRKKAAGEEIVDPVIRLRGTNTGAFLPPGTRIKLGSMLVVPNGLSFELDFRNQNGTAWTGATPVLSADHTICAGMCAFFAEGTTTKFQLIRQGGVTQWASGYACYSGVDGAEVRPFAQITPSFTDWREIIQ